MHVGGTHIGTCCTPTHLAMKCMSETRLSLVDRTSFSLSSVSRWKPTALPCRQERGDRVLGFGQVMDRRGGGSLFSNPPAQVHRPTCLIGPWD